MPIDRPAAAAYVSPLCDAVLDVLSRYTAFPWATLRAACERVGIEPRKREVQGVTVYDTSFFIERFERLSKPKASAKTRKETDAPPQDAATA